MKINDKVKVVKPIRECCVLVAKTGQTATLVGMSDNIVSIRLNNGKIINTHIDKIEPYTIVKKFSLTSCTNEELIDRYDKVQKIIYYDNNTAKQWREANINSEKIRNEILRRMM